MNTISYSDATNEIGVDSLRQITQRFGLNEGCWNARFAASIVTRSELAMFGRSIPRFAVRVYLDNDRKYFVNARRMQTATTYASPLGRRKTRLPERFRITTLASQPARGNGVAKIMQGQPCLADCFLQSPAHLNDFHIITTDLGTAYGEVEYKADNYRGVPYVQHIVMAGGGLCAQATCFMAAALLHEYAAKVSGLAEITHYATNADFQKLELCVYGLDFAEMSQYFQAVRLNAILQRSMPIVPLWQTVDLFSTALRAYVLSGMPVILSVDCGRMAGEFRGIYPRGLSLRQGHARVSIYEENGEPAPNMDLNRANRHAILVVGVSKRAEDRRLCFHDPLIKAFMTTTTDRIARAGCYTLDFDEVADRFLMPITPSEVRFPLVQWLSRSDMKREDGMYRPGLFEIAMDLQSPLGGKLPVVEADRAQFQYLRLLQAGNFADKLKELLHEHEGFLCDAPERKIPLLKAAVDNTPSLLRRLKRGKNNWVWMQCTRRSIWVWDAEKEPLARDAKQTTEDAKMGFLRLILEDIQDRKWMAVPFGETQQQDENKSNSGSARRAALRGLKRSLITSISVNGIDEALVNWPKDLRTKRLAKYADLYAFMQSDTNSFLNGNLPAGEERKDAVAAMARLAEMPAAIRKVAESISTKFLLEKRVRLVAMATFIPEITSGNIALAKQAISACLFLIRLAKSLQALGHPMSTIQMVAGSLIDGVWPALNFAEVPAQPAFGANLVHPEKALNRLIRRLKPVAREIMQSANGKTRGKHPLQLAFELEPGPLYVLGTIESVRRFCEKLEHDPILSPVVGLNIDIHHWGFVAGIRADDLREARIFNRIVHGHVSDHGRGLFSSGVINSIHGKEDYLPWLNLLADRSAANRRGLKDYPKFSRFVSVELEASKSRGMVETSCQGLDNYLTDLIL
jgi:hypothetical protein